MTAAIAAAVMAVAVGALVLAERIRSPRRMPAKLLASTGFIAVALAVGALDSGFGRAVLVGLALSWIGDVALLGTARAWFLAGLVAFLAAHVAYATAFAQRGLDAFWGVAAAAVAATAAAVIAGTLLPRVDAALKVPVVAYVVVISAMVVLAAATVGRDADARILAGAVLFYVSDLFVARERFVTPGWPNRAVGLPLYYGGQLLIAWSAGG